MVWGFANICLLAGVSRGVGGEDAEQELLMSVQFTVPVLPDEFDVSKLGECLRKCFFFLENLLNKIELLKFMLFVVLSGIAELLCL